MKRGSENQWPICISSWQWFGTAHGFNQCNEVVVKAVSLVSLGGFVFSWCLRHGTIPDIIVVSKQITTTKKPALVTVHYVLCFLNYEMRWNRFVLFCDWNLGFGFAGKRQLVKAPEMSCIWVSVGNLIWVKALLSIYDVVANVWIGLDKFKHRFNLNQYTESHWKCVLEILYPWSLCYLLKIKSSWTSEWRGAYCKFMWKGRWNIWTNWGFSIQMMEKFISQKYICVGNVTSYLPNPNLYKIFKYSKICIIKKVWVFWLSHSPVSWTVTHKTWLCISTARVELPSLRTEKLSEARIDSECFIFE